MRKWMSLVRVLVLAAVVFLAVGGQTLRAFPWCDDAYQACLAGCGGDLGCNHACDCQLAACQGQILGPDCLGN